MFKASVQGALLSGSFMRLCRTEWKLHRESKFHPGNMPELIGTSTSCNGEEVLGQGPKIRQNLNTEVHRKLGEVPIAMELRNRRVGWAKRMAEQIQNKDSSCQQVLAAIFGHACTDKYPSMTSEEELTAHATPWAKSVSR